MAQRQLSILVVDDDPSMRRLLLRALTSAEVKACGSVDEAVDACAKGSFELIVTDLLLPDGRGTDIVRTLRAARNHAPAVLITATPRELSEDEQGLFVDVIAKPFRLSALYDALEVAKAAARPRAHSAARLKARRVESAARILAPEKKTGNGS